tara:strand:- start:12381 stop:12911 length:531 start_codon:yes stop_codon:yes gene_type:complete
MYEKLTKLFLLILLFLLQSCSGGKIGDFLESSFKNIDQDSLNNKEENTIKKKKNSNLNEKYSNNQVNNQDRKIFKNNNYQIIKKNEKEENLIKEKTLLEENIEVTRKKNPKPKNIKKKKNYKPESYRVIVIINEVDPASPLDEFSNVLKNSNLNFEIENIQRYPSGENKKSKVGQP